MEERENASLQPMLVVVIIIIFICNISEPPWIQSQNREKQNWQTERQTVLVVAGESLKMDPCTFQWHELRNSLSILSQSESDILTNANAFSLETMVLTSQILSLSTSLLAKELPSLKSSFKFQLLDDDALANDPGTLFLQPVEN